MMIEQHYDEEVLAEFLAEPRDAVSRDKHLASCDLCRRSLDSLHATARILKEPAVWGTPISTAPRPETLAFLRGVATTMADEDATAAVWIKELLAGPREGWAARLAEHPEWRTGGMVRRLLVSADATITLVPADALEITALAVSIAKTMTETQTVRHLRGLAAYDHGYALWYTGALMEALEEFNYARGQLAEVAGAELDIARIDVMRAMTYQILERRDEALSIANAAAVVFDRYQDSDRYAAARSAVATTLQSVRRLREAVAIHEEIAADQRVSDSWRVSAIHNKAICYQELGEFDNAVGCLVHAIGEYERLGMMTFRSKSRWVLAQLFAQQGKHGQALPLFNELRSEFEELGMANDVAMLSLDISESLLGLGRSAEIGEVCHAALAYFTASGLSQTESALRGLAYLQEAVAADRVTPDAIRGIRAYLLQPAEKPAGLFALPPQ